MMKTAYIIACIMMLTFLISLVGCKKKKEEIPPEVGVLKTPAEMEPVLLNLKTDVESSPDIQKEMDQIIERCNASTGKTIMGDKLEVLYELVSYSDSDISLTRRALDVFIELDTKEVIRESLLHENPDIVIMASEAIIRDARQGEPDKQAIPYLSTVLSRNNFIQPGSEAATIHVIMKEKLVEAIQQTAGIEVQKIDVDDPKEVEKILQNVPRKQ